MQIKIRLFFEWMQKRMEVTTMMAVVVVVAAAAATAVMTVACRQHYIRSLSFNN